MKHRDERSDADILNYHLIGQRIRRYRLARGLSQEKLAEYVNISTTHLSHIETANTKLSLSVFVKIAEALSVQADDLLYDSNELSTLQLQQKISDALKNCSVEELLILYDIINATVESLHKNMDPRFYPTPTQAGK